jgi:hypothetical protein
VEGNNNNYCAKRPLDNSIFIGSRHNRADVTAGLSSHAVGNVLNALIVNFGDGTFIDNLCKKSKLRGVGIAKVLAIWPTSWAVIAGKEALSNFCCVI